MIGMELDEPGNDEVAADVLGTRGRRAAAEVGDRAVLGDDEAGFDHLVGEHQPRVGEGKNGHGQAANRVTSMERSATTSRTSSSCTMATIAAPRRFFSAI